MCSSARRRACAAVSGRALTVVPATHGSTPCTCGVKNSSPGGDRIAGNSSLHEWRASTLQQRSNERANTAADSSGRTGRLKKRSRRLPLTGPLPPAFLGGSVIQNSAGRQRYSKTPTSNAMQSAEFAGDVHPRQPHRSTARERSTQRLRTRSHALGRALLTPVHSRGRCRRNERWSWCCTSCVLNAVHGAEPGSLSAHLEHGGPQPDRSALSRTGHEPFTRCGTGPPAW